MKTGFHGYGQVEMGCNAAPLGIRTYVSATGLLEEADLPLVVHDSQNMPDMSTSSYRIPLSDAMLVVALGVTIISDLVCRVDVPLHLLLFHVLNPCRKLEVLLSPTNR